LEELETLAFRWFYIGKESCPVCLKAKKESRRDWGTFHGEMQGSLFDFLLLRFRAHQLPLQLSQALLI